MSHSCHQEFYWQELADSPKIEVTEGDVKYFQYLVGLQYKDPDYSFSLQTTRVVVEHRLIVASRVPVKADGTRATMEADTPIHVT